MSVCVGSSEPAVSWGGLALIALVIKITQQQITVH